MTRRTPLYGWLTAEALSLTGTRVSMVALPWFVLTTTGSPTQTGFVALAEMLPLVVLKVLGGPIIDRLGARRVSIACDLGSVVVVGAIPLLYVAGVLSLPVFFLLVAGAGALRGPGDAAKAALTPAIVAHAAVPMERATGLHSSVERGAGMLGFAFAGGLVAVLGPTNALAVDALSFLLSAVVLATTTRSLAGPAPLVEEVAQQPSRNPGEPPAGPSYLRQLREGWDYLRRDPVLVGLTVMIAVTNLLDLAWASVIMPVWAQESGAGAALLGASFAVFSGASMVGALVAAAWGERIPRFRTYLAAYLITGVPRFVVLAVDAPLPVVLAVFVVGGFASGFLNPILGAVFFERIPLPLTGRISSLSTGVCYALMPLGGLLGGLLISGFGLSPALLIIGAAYFLATMAPAVLPSFREMDRRPADAQPGHSPLRAPTDTAATS